LIIQGIVCKPPLWKRGVRGDLNTKYISLGVISSDKDIFENTLGVLERIWAFVILEISPGPSFPKRDLRIFTEKSEEP